VTATTATMPRRIALRRRPVVPLLIVAGTVVAVLVVAFIGSNVWASVQQRSLARRFDASATAWERLDPVARSEVTVPVGRPIARLQIASIGLDAIVVEGATPGLMRRGPGHLPGSATPGENGVAIVTANRVAFGGFFLRLDRLGVGDQIEVESPIGRTTYTVTEVRVVPSDELDLETDSSVPVLMLFGSSRLIGGGDRLVVRAVAGA
jgi:sortase A